MGTTLIHGHQANMVQTPLPGPVGFIGAGKVGTALAALLNARGIDIAGVSGRDISSARRMAREAGLGPSTALASRGTVAASHIIFLTVPDDDIQPLCEQIAKDLGWRQGQFVVHCSGALPSDVLNAAREQGAFVASFHPLQTFASLEAAMENLPGSTFGIEGDPPVVDALNRLAALLGGLSLNLTPQQKTLYHAAATIASNYTVALASLASDLLVQAGVADDPNTALGYLMPLLKGTVENLAKVGLPGALTGALARGDVGTVARHIRALEAVDSSLAELYRHLARAALPLAVQKGQIDDETLARFEDLL